MGSGELILDTTHIQRELKHSVRRTCRAMLLACYIHSTLFLFNPLQYGTDRVLQRNDEPKPAT